MAEVSTELDVDESFPAPPPTSTRKNRQTAIQRNFHMDVLLDVLLGVPNSPSIRREA
jgi:hypothetical protein